MTLIIEINEQPNGNIIVELGALQGPEPTEREMVYAKGIASAMGQVVVPSISQLVGGTMVDLTQNNKNPMNG